MKRSVQIATVLFCGTSWAALGQTPTFSLWVTEVNGVPCPSCPTQELPPGEAVAGDIIRVDAFVEGWDDNPGSGFCTGNLAPFPIPCTVGAINACVGRHCSDSGSACNANASCNSNLCVPSQCVSAPQLGLYQFSIDASTYHSGSNGALLPSRIACSASDCSDLGSGDCSCTHGFATGNDCTCLSFASCLPDGYCAAPASAYIDLTRVDWVFHSYQTIAAVSTIPGANWEWASLLTAPLGLVDAGARRYMGTHLLTPTLDAGGAFEIAFVSNINSTFALDDRATGIEPVELQSVIIHIACTPENCDDGDPCTVDTCGADGVSCSHDPVVCPAGSVCAGGRCVRQVKSINTTR